MTELYEQCTQDVLAHGSRQEELARHVEDLVEVRREREARERAESDLTERIWSTMLSFSVSVLEGKESAPQLISPERNL
jgi:hypothetical protein